MQADDLFGTPLDQAEIDFANEGGETYICGNPPYLGSKRQVEEHKEDLKDLFQTYTGDWKILDYVSGWFLKSAEYSRHTTADAALVSTNSVCQGQQVHVLWPLIARLGGNIIFAHTSFKWANLASQNAGVTVVIIGISQNASSQRTLYEDAAGGGTVSRTVDHINAYLVPSKDTIVEPLRRHICGLPEMFRGNSPTDGGHLLLTRDDVSRLELSDNQKAKFIRPFVGSAELIRGLQRYCIWIEDRDLAEAQAIGAFEARFGEVRDFRLASAKAATVKAAAWPHRFDERKPLPVKPTICIPVTSSENREYLPIGLLPPGTAVSNLAFGMPVDNLWVLALIASRMQLIWIATVCSRMRTDYRFTNTMGWNTFPIPKLTEQNKADLTGCAEDILLAREAHFPATIADLYDPDKMPENLRHAHERNDEVLERIYIGRRFRNDTERLEKLFELYTRMTSAKAA